MTGRQRPKRRRLTLLLLALLASPQVVATAFAGQSGGGTQANPDAEVGAQLIAYAEWLNRANQVQLRSTGQIMSLGPAMQQINASGASDAVTRPRLRALLEGSLAEIRAARTDLDALDTPDFPALQLPQELSAAGMKQQMLHLNQNYIDLLNPLLRLTQAGPTNASELRSTMQGLLSQVGSIYDSQILFARATMETAPHNSSDRMIHGFEVSNLRAMKRVVDALSPFNPRVDPGLSTDLVAVAGELEVQIRNAETWLTAELADMERELASATSESRRALVRRAIAISLMSRDYFPVARRLAVHIRNSAASVRGRIITQTVAATIFQPFRQFRIDIDAVAIRQNQAAAGS
jgi:hypothetical protein